MMKIKASASIWLILCFLICVIILVLALVLVVFPKKNQVSDVQTDIDNVETQILAETNRLNQLRQYDKDPEQFLRQIDVLEERMPQNVELADIIQQIDYAAEEAGLDFFSFTPSVPIAYQDFYTVTCDVILNGRYFNLIEFFNHVERLPRSVKVVYLNLIQDDSGLPYLQITLTFKAFFTTNQGIEELVQQGV
ncbi:MAG: type 4a pilus biogenesis protein PilO [Actinobacteria bacterium]|nr:type 4a pilus biogenesis protein PilO [Actinomycetota bacterium]